MSVLRASTRLDMSFKSNCFLGLAAVVTVVFQRQSQLQVLDFNLPRFVFLS